MTEIKLRLEEVNTKDQVLILTLESQLQTSLKDGEGTGAPGKDQAQ